jgi:hypothetical protein
MGATVNRQVEAVMAEEARVAELFSHALVDEGLYGLHSLAPFEPLKLGPTMLKPVGYREYTRVLDDEAFAAGFRSAAPFLDLFGLEEHGLVFAGSCAGDLLWRSLVPGLHRKAFNLFPVGHDDASFLSVLNKLQQYLAEILAGMRVRHSTERVTFTGFYGFRPYTVQIFKRRTPSLDDLLRSFDLGSSAVAWDGRRVTLSALGKLTAEHRVVMFDPYKRRANSEWRLSDASSQGFAVCLQNLSVYLWGRINCQLNAVDGFPCSPDSKSCSAFCPSHKGQLPFLELKGLMANGDPYEGYTYTIASMRARTPYPERAAKQAFDPSSFALLAGPAWLDAVSPPAAMSAEDWYGFAFTAVID